MSRKKLSGECTECKEYAQQLWKRLCKRCYKKLWSRKKCGSSERIDRTDFVCPDCNKESKHAAKGLCQKCYTQLNIKRRRENIGKCSQCEETKQLRVGSICSRCYKKDSGRVICCKICLEDRLHHAKGMCHLCYAKQSEELKRTVGKKMLCKVCQLEKIHHAKELCSQCYCRLHKKQWIKPIIRCRGCTHLLPHMAKGLCSRCYWHEIGGHKYAHQRNSRKLQLAATLTKEEWLQTLEKYDYSCAYCGIPTSQLNQEHWIPLSRGGEYTTENIVPACKLCNSRKHTMTGNEFLELLGREREYAR